MIIQHSYPHTPPDTLLKQTANKVFRIHPKEEWQIKANKKINKQPETRIIIEYVYKSRTEYYRIQNIKRIVPMVLQ